jgi:hypothetical protein
VSYDRCAASLHALKIIASTPLSITSCSCLFKTLSYHISPSDLKFGSLLVLRRASVSIASTSKPTSGSDSNGCPFGLAAFSLSDADTLPSPVLAMLINGTVAPHVRSTMPTVGLVLNFHSCVQDRLQSTRLVVMRSNGALVMCSREATAPTSSFQGRTAVQAKCNGNTLHCTSQQHATAHCSAPCVDVKMLRRRYVGISMEIFSSGHRTSLSLGLARSFDFRLIRLSSRN